MSKVFDRRSSNEHIELLAEEVVTGHELQKFAPKDALLADEVNRIKLRLEKLFTETSDGKVDSGKHHTQTRIGVVRSDTGKHTLLVGREWVGIDGTVSNNQPIKLSRHSVSAQKAGELVEFINSKRKGK